VSVLRGKLGVERRAQAAAYYVKHAGGISANVAEGSDATLSSNLKSRSAMTSRSVRAASFEVSILTGGLSSRMGRDKSKLVLGGKTLLAHARAASAGLRCPIRVIGRDLVPRCGPLGGVYTALKTTPARQVLFLSCDMPLVPPGLLRRLILSPRSKIWAAFTGHDQSPGFPFLLKAEALAVVERLLRERRLALQILAAELNARVIRPTRREAVSLLNVNTPADWDRCRELWRRSSKTSRRKTI